VLTRQDWRSNDGSWTPKSIGHWEVQVEKAGTFNLQVTLPAAAVKGTMLQVKLGQFSHKEELPDGAKNAHIKGIKLPAGPLRIEAWSSEGETRRGMKFVEIGRQ
jgi:hypothetical protein